MGAHFYGAAQVHLIGKFGAAALFLTLALIPLASHGAACSQSSENTGLSDADTRTFQPCSKNTIASQTSTEDSAATPISAPYYIAGCGNAVGTQGAQSVSWGISGEPTGISIGSTGLVEGTPTVPGSYNVTVTCTNNIGSEQQTFAWTVNALAQGLEGLANVRFICPDGNDLNDGTTVAKRWSSLSKATGLPDTTHVYLCDDGVFASGTLGVDWDSPTISTYYVDTGNSNQITAYGEGTGSGQGVAAEIPNINVSGIGGTFGVFDVAESISGNIKKWSPGHWYQLRRNNVMLTDQSARLNQYASINAQGDDIVGVVIPVMWSRIEGSAAGDYSPLATYDLDFSTLRGYGLRYMIKILDIHYNGGTALSFYFPLYLRSAGLTYLGTNNDTGWNRTQSAAVTYWQGMIAAVAARYDDDPYFEGVILNRESTSGAANGWEQFGGTSALSQAGLQSMCASAATELGSSSSVLNMNYERDSIVENVVQSMDENGCGIGAPDVLGPNSFFSETPAAESLQGIHGNPVGEDDLRGVVPVIWGMEDSNMNGELGSQTAQQIWDYADGTLRASHLVWQWDIQSVNSCAAPRDCAGEISTEINSEVFTYTSCPSIYGGICWTPP